MTVSLKAHLVFVTKYRADVFTAEHLARLKEIFAHVSRSFEVTVLEFNGGHDHVHLLIDYPTTVQLSKLINSLKGVSSRQLRSEFPELIRQGGTQALWSPSYFITSIRGAPLEVLRAYVQQQREP